MRNKFFGLISVFLVFSLVFCSCLADEFFCRGVLGCAKSDIVLIQTGLSRLGYTVGNNSGIYDADTDGAVTTWCLSKGIDIDTVTSNDVIVGLARDLYAGGNVDFESNLLAVRTIEILLRRWGFYVGNMDGVADGDLYLAIGRFRDYLANCSNVYLSGDSRSIEIYDAYDYLEEPTYRHMLNDFNPVGNIIGPDTSYLDVRRVQSRLKCLGYFKGDCDGRWDDTVFGAVNRFQSDNGIIESNVGVATQTVLFSDQLCEVYDPENLKKKKKGYRIYVNTEESYVSVFGYSNGAYDVEIKHFICSCGAKKSPTIKGTFKLEERRGEWYQISYDPVGWVQYAYRFVGHYYFHSVLFSKKGATKPTKHSAEDLGKNVSAGCVRLSVEDCRWIYENCDIGTVVVIE